MHNIAQIFKKIIFSITTLTIIGLLIVDYNYFNKNKRNDLNKKIQIIGNNIIPDQKILNIVNETINQKTIYTSIVNQIKIIDVSSNKKVVIIDEDEVRFYDDKYYYMSSGKKIAISENLVTQELYPIFKDYLNQKNLSKKITFLTNYMFNQYPDLYNQLESVDFSKDRKLSIGLNNYKTILIDQNKESINNQNIIKKINILKSFNSQFQDTLEIKEVDLTWKDKIFIKSI